MLYPFKSRTDHVNSFVSLVVAWGHLDTPRNIVWLTFAAVTTQASDGSTAPNIRNILLQLALRLIERAATTTGVPSSAFPDRFALHLDLLQALERTDDALVMVATASGELLSTFGLHWAEVAAVDVLRVMLTGSRGWGYCLLDMHADLRVVVQVKPFSRKVLLCKRSRVS